MTSDEKTVQKLSKALIVFSIGPVLLVAIFSVILGSVSFGFGALLFLAALSSAGFFEPVFLVALAAYILTGLLISFGLSSYKIYARQGFFIFAGIIAVAFITLNLKLLFSLDALQDGGLLRQNAYEAYNIFLTPVFIFVIYGVVTLRNPSIRRLFS